MGCEIELKIPVTENEFLRIFNTICDGSKNVGAGKACVDSGVADGACAGAEAGTSGTDLHFTFPELLFKSDEYYSQYKTHEERLKKEPRVIRIRTEENRGLFGENCTPSEKTGLGEKNNCALESIPDFSNFQEIKKWIFEQKDVLPSQKTAAGTERKQSGNLEERSNDSPNFHQASAFFTIKTKDIRNGVEFNNEEETAVEDAEVLRSFFSKTGFECWFRKEKIAFSSHCTVFQGAPLSDNDCSARDAAPSEVGLDKSECNQEVEPLSFHLELEIINSELTYLEIEYTENDAQPEFIRAQLENLVRRLGLNPAKKDSRSWVQIINGDK